MDNRKIVIGLIVNPWAGIGGEVALKGSDGEDIRKQAISLGAKLNSEKRVLNFLKNIEIAQSKVSFLSFPFSMGENVLKACNFEYQILEYARKSEWSFNSEIGIHECSAIDTQEAATQMAKEGVDIIIFAGGDGTARDIAIALSGFPKQLCLGIPAGVKIQSGVYGRSPESVAEIIIGMTDRAGIDVSIAEVRDIDEEALRQGRVESRYFAELSVPSLPDRGLSIQGSKMGRAQLSESEVVGELLVYEEIAACLVDRFELEIAKNNLLLIVGAGRTTQVFKRLLCDDGAFQESLLGVDVFLNRQCIARDASEKDILSLFDKHPEFLKVCKIVVSVVGGQGFIFGRGSQPISSQVIRRVLDLNGQEAIVVLASQNKILALQEKSLFVDTGDAALDHQLSGSRLVLVNYEQEMLCQVNA